jgi:hypothetical protein
LNKSVIGAGSASIVLVFAVLCLTIFALITLASAENDKAMSNAEAKLVKGYYQADTLAELILSDIIEAMPIPDIVRGIEIESKRQDDIYIVTFSCPISDRKELYVQVAVYDDYYYILAWHMRNTVKWEADPGLPVWMARED